ncbi:MAG: GrpB family protein [Cellvibrionales bacterium]|nr:GrpB family protein [Cellvibrionales bacterium]
MQVEVKPYDPVWRQWFQTIATLLATHLDGIHCLIEHIGSTSVEGLAAKPIIDIDILLEDTADFDTVKSRLMALGYEYKGNLGLNGREMFKDALAVYPHNLYVCDPDALAVKNHLAFKDYLKTHPESVEAYGALKKDLAKRHPGDVDAYCEAKSEFIGSILKRCRFDAGELHRIKEANKRN